MSAESRGRRATKRHKKERQRAELAWLRKAPADAATPLADRLIEIDAQVRDLRRQVQLLQKEVEKAKK